MRYAISLDVGGTTIKSGLVAEDGAVFAPRQEPTPTNPGELIKSLAQIVANYEASIASGDLEGAAGPIEAADVINTVGLDVPGIVDELAGLAVFSANLGWRDFPAQEQLANACGRPIAFGHDVRTGALAEGYWGQNLANFFYVAIGTGIATVLVLDQKAIAASSWAGELGQITVQDADGNEKSLEQVASATGIANAALSRGLIDENGGAAAVYERADTGDVQAKTIIDYAVKTLVAGIAPVVAAVGEIPIVIGGGLANRGEDLFAHIQGELDKALGIVPTPKVTGAKLGSQSQLKGAGLRAFRAEGHCLQ